MRILQVLAGMGVGGAEQLVLHLCQWLRDNGHEIEAVNIYRGNDLQANFEQMGIKVHHLRLVSGVSQYYPLTLVRFLRRYRADVVHCHNTSWRKTAAACRWAGMPCVWTLHNYHDQWIREQKKWMLKAVQYTQAFVGIEPRVRELIVQELPTRPERVHYVANGIPDIFDPCPTPVEWGVPIPQGARIIGMVSRLAENKDPHTLVSAMVEVHKHYPAVHLVFAGSGPLQEQVRQHIAQVEAESYMHLLGLRRDVPDILHALDIFVLSSHLEGQPLAILEAMSAQRPIVATHVGGNPILLDGGRCGVLVPARNPRVLAEAILELLTNREKAEQLARNARQRFLEHFTIDAMGKRYLEIYHQAIEEFERR